MIPIIIWKRTARLRDYGIPINIIFDNSVIELYILIIENVADASAFPAVVRNESDRDLDTNMKGETTMKKITATDALELSISERIQLVEDIWDTIIAKASSVELTEEEKNIIDARLEKYHQNPELGSPWEDVYKRIVDRQ